MFDVTKLVKFEVNGQSYEFRVSYEDICNFVNVAGTKPAKAMHNLVVSTAVRPTAQEIGDLIQKTGDPALISVLAGEIADQLEFDRQVKKLSSASTSEPVNSEAA